MDLLEQLTSANAEPALIAQLRAMLAEKDDQIAARHAALQRQKAELQASHIRKTELIAERDFKIRALTLELAHLSDRLAVLLRRRPCLHADETPVRQLDPGQGKTLHAYLWAYRSNQLDEGPSIIVFDYQSGRAGAHARAFLAGWRDHLMVDDYVGCEALFADGVTELACLAQVRR